MESPDATPRIYPSIRQSFSILGIVILMAVACGPIVKISVWVGDEAAMAVYYTSAFGLSFYIAHSLRKRHQLSSRYHFTMTSWWLVIPLYFGTVALLAGLISPVAASIPMPESAKEVMRTLVSQTGVFAFLVFVLIAPLLEELIFRGIILDGLLRRYSPLTSILVSSVIFGLAHLNPWQFVTAFFLGCFMGWVYLRSGSLAGCVLIHMSANFSGYLLRLLLAFSGGASKDARIILPRAGTMLSWSQCRCRCYRWSYARGPRFSWLDLDASWSRDSRPGLLRWPVGSPCAGMPLPIPRWEPLLTPHLIIDRPYSIWALKDHLGPRIHHYGRVHIATQDLQLPRIRVYTYN